MITLHLAQNSKDDIEQVHFKNHNELITYFEEFEYHKKTVFVFAYRTGGSFDTGEGEIIITENPYWIINYLKEIKEEHPFGIGSDDIFLQEYKSYEDAYKVALFMREPNELCYNNKEN